MNENEMLEEEITAEDEDFEGAEPVEDHEGFRYYGQPVQDDGFADYLIRKMQERKDGLKELKAFYEAQYAKAEERVNRQNENDRIRLMQYFDQVPHHETKTEENYPLPSGKLYLKRQEPEWDYKTGKDEAVKWLEENQMADKVKIEKSVNWAALKKLVTLSGNGKVVLTETGEIIPGLSGEARPNKFDYAMSKAK